MRVELVPEAEVELQEATAWYLDRGLDHGVEAAIELAQRFVEEFARVSELICERPKLNAEFEPGLRRALLSGFPYSLLYSLEPDRVVVLAVMHHKRKPGYWRER